MALYDVIRFYKSGKKKLVHYKVTKEQAQEWCNSPCTERAHRYFDGFADTGTYGARNTPIYSHYFTPTKELN